MALVAPSMPIVHKAKPASAHVVAQLPMKTSAVTRLHLLACSCPDRLGRHFVHGFSLPVPPDDDDDDVHSSRSVIGEGAMILGSGCWRLAIVSSTPMDVEGRGRDQSFRHWTMVFWATK